MNNSLAVHHLSLLSNEANSKGLLKTMIKVWGNLLFLILLHDVAVGLVVIVQPAQTPRSTTIKRVFKGPIRLSNCKPHGDMREVSHHLLWQHLHMNVSVIKLLPHLPQLTHGVVQVTFTLTPVDHTGRIFNSFLKRLKPQLMPDNISVFPYATSCNHRPSCSSLTWSRGWLQWLISPDRRRRLGAAPQVFMEVVRAIDKGLAPKGIDRG